MQVVSYRTKALDVHSMNTFGNSRYQQSVDRYVSGENAPIEDVQRAWGNTVASVGPRLPFTNLFIKLYAR
jgi:hypothetical protein